MQKYAIHVWLVQKKNISTQKRKKKKSKANKSVIANRKINLLGRTCIFFIACINQRDRP